MGPPGYSNISIDAALGGVGETIRFRVYNDDGSNRPTGSALADGTIVLPYKSIWTINFSSLTLIPGYYHVVISPGTGDTYWYWNDQGCLGMGASENSGVSWIWCDHDETFAVRIRADVSLPVALASFSARCEEQSVILEWITESEVDNLGFILERNNVGADHDSPGEGEWQSVASYQTHPELKGQGNTSSRTEYLFVDKDVIPEETYAYRLSDVDIYGNLTINNMLTITLDALPEITELLPAYPNPFNPQTNIQYTLSEDINVTLSVVDMMGRTIQTIIQGQQQVAGSHSVYWNGKDDSGRMASSGMYLLVLKAGDINKTQKVMLIR